MSEAPVFPRVAHPGLFVCSATRTDFRGLRHAEGLRRPLYRAGHNCSQGKLLHGGLEWRVSALRRYPSSDAHEFGLPELAHSVERFRRDGNLCRASGVVA